METYERMTKRHQEENNALPMYWAFSEGQWEGLLNQLGLTEETAPHELCQYRGAIVRKTDVDRIQATLDAHSIELEEAYKDPEFFKGACLYEMCNHEYGINWQADWDVITALGFKVRYSDGNELDEAPMTDKQKQMYKLARQEYYKLADEKGWI